MPRVILFVLLAGAVIYGLVWPPCARAARDAKPAPLAPDDDPVFLAQLDRRMAEERRQRAVKEAREAKEKREAKEDREREQPGS